MCNYTYIGLISCDILKHYGYLTHAQNRSMVIETERYSDTDSITRAIARFEISCPKWHQHWYGPRESFYSLLRNDQHIIESTNPSDCIIDLTANSVHYVSISGHCCQIGGCYTIWNFCD